MKTVFVSGDFNVLHLGHLRLLRYASERGDRLVVGLFSHQPSRAAELFPDEVRLEALHHVSSVDEVVLIRDNLEQVIEEFRPAIVVKGAEYRLRHNAEQSWLDAWGGRLVFAPGDATLDLPTSSTSTKTQTLQTVESLQYVHRRRLDAARLRGIVEAFDVVSVWTVGDIIVDDYIDCEPLGMSREDASLAVSPVSSARYTGGAGVVAAHVSGLGAASRLCSIIGDDDAGEFARSDLGVRRVEALLIVDPDRPTTVKERYRVNAATLLRVNRLSRLSIGDGFQQKVLQDLASWAEQVPSQTSAVLFADFNYGCLPQSLVEIITRMGHAMGLRMTADSQTSSQLGDVGRFFGMDLITPTEHEARVAMRDMDDGLVVLADALQQRTAARNIIMTLGDQGALLHVTDKDRPYVTDQIPSLAGHVIDPAGAGDSLLATATVAMCAGANIWEAAYLGSLAAAIQVGRSGNIPILRDELLELLD